MAYNYDHARVYGDTIHSDPSTYNVGHPGEPITMAQRVQTDLGKDCTITMSGTLLRFTFAEQLTSEEQTLLATAVANQKAVDDWPYSPPDPVEDVKIVDSEINLPATLKGLQDLTGRSFYRRSFAYEPVANEDNEFSEQFSEDLTLQGGEYHIIGTPDWGDYVEMMISDENGIFGLPGYVVKKFVEKEYVFEGANLSNFISPDGSDVPWQLFFTFRYVSTGNNPPKLVVRYNLRRIPNANHSSSSSSSSSSFSSSSSSSSSFSSSSSSWSSSSSSSSSNSSSSSSSSSSSMAA